MFGEKIKVLLSLWCFIKLFKVVCRIWYVFIVVDFVFGVDFWNVSIFLSVIFVSGFGGFLGNLWNVVLYDVGVELILVDWINVNNLLLVFMGKVIIVVSLIVKNWNKFFDIIVLVFI